MKRLLTIAIVATLAAGLGIRAEDGGHKFVPVTDAMLQKPDSANSFGSASAQRRQLHGFQPVDAQARCRPVLPHRHALTQLRGLATYTVPRINMIISTVFQDKPGDPGIDAPLAANYSVPVAQIIPSLGRPLALNSISASRSDSRFVATNGCWLGSIFAPNKLKCHADEQFDIWPAAERGVADANRVPKPADHANHCRVHVLRKRAAATEANL